MLHSVKGVSKGRPIYYGWVVVVAGFFCLSVAFAIQYSFGVFFVPLQEAFGWSRAATSLAMTIHLAVFGLTVLPVAWTIQRVGARTVYTSAAVLIGISLVLCGRVSEQWQLYLLFGVPLGIGTSTIAPTTLGIIPRWFTRHRGIALGIASAGSGFGTLVGAPLSNAMIDAYGWRTAFILLGVGACLIVLVCAYFMRGSPQELPGRRTALPVVGQHDAATQPSKVPGMTLRQALRTRALLLIAVANGVCIFTVRVVIVHIVPHAMDIGISAPLAALAVGTIGGMSILGRLIMGFVQDRIGAKRSLIICLVSQGVAMLALPFIGSAPWFFVYAVIFGFMYGGDIPQVPALAAQCFGVASIGVIWGLIATVGNVASAAGPIAAGYIFDQTASYTAIFAGTGLGMMAAAFWLRKLRVNQ